MSHCINPSVSDEKFTNALFLPYINAGRINSSSGEPLYLDKGRVSKLLSQKDDVPRAFRNALNRFHIKESTEQDFTIFLDENIAPTELATLIDEMQSEIVQSASISYERKSILQEMKEIPTAYLLEAFFDALRVDNKVATQKHTLWKQGVNSLELVVGDLFQFALQTTEKKKLVVIPVNTAFDTKVSFDSDVSQPVIVSPNTIHGKWLVNCRDAGVSIDSIRSIIVETLNLQKTNDNAKDIGTIVTVPVGDVTYVLLAISRFDEQGVAHSSIADMHKALLSLLSYYDTRGNGYPLYLPLMGTGRSRANLNYAESYELIKTTMLDNAHLIQGKATIVVTEEAMEEIRCALSEEESHT